MTRTLSASEKRFLTAAQQAYLLSNPLIVSLQLHVIPSEALYRTPRHGAVTIDRAIELDALHSALKPAAPRSAPATYDAYAAAEDDFIDRHGMSSGLS
jgi:hypothetical protein